MTLLSDWPLLTALIAAGALLVWGLSGSRRPSPRTRYGWYGGSRNRPPHVASGDVRSLRPDAAAQLRFVEHATFRAQSVLRRQEGLVFAAAQAAVREARLDWHIFAQVSLGEVLLCQDKDGFNAINAKRVDLLVADATFRPLAAIEYQGKGHHLGQAAARDAIKKEALRKAGVGYIEITHEDGPKDVRREIGRLALRLQR